MVKSDSINAATRSLSLKVNENILFFFGSQIICLSENLDLLNRSDLYIDGGSVKIINVYHINGLIWILTRNKGIIRGEYYDGKFVMKDKIFQDDLITTMCQDSNEGIWLTSHYNGVFYIPHPKNYSFAKSTDLPTIKKSLHVVNDSTYVFAQDPTAFTLVRPSHDIIRNTQISTNEYIVDFYLDPQNIELIIIGNHSLEVQPFDTLVSPKIYTTLVNNDKLILNDNSIIFAGGQFIAKYRSKKEISRFTRNHKVPIHALGQNMGQLYFGTNRGLFPFKITGDSVIQDYSLVNTNNEIFNAYISNLENYKEGLWVAAKGIGVAYLSDSIEFVIKEEDGLSSLDFKELTQDGDTLWVSTSNGLNKLVFSSDLKLESLKQINTNHGLSSNEVAGIETSDKRIFISTANGYDIINRKELLGKDDSLMLKIDNIQSIKNNSIYCNDNSLDYTENYLAINYSAVQYSASGNHTFRYRLIPLNEKWKTTNENQVEFNNLAPENYTFEIEIENNQGNWVGRDDINFSINPPYWRTWWFVGLCSLMLLSIAYFIFKRREKSFREKIKIENEMNLLRGKALRAQVNPHFIFNTLNAIQNFVLEGDFENSNKFITYFSKLIRKILQQSPKDKVTLAEEIDILNMYLMIEQMRYDNKFTFEVEIDKKINTEKIKIPPMLIQPYVENSIWHGLADRMKSGLVKVSFDINMDGHLECIVLDNGIGRSAAKKIKNNTYENRESVGMSLSNDRLKALNNSRIDHVLIDDLYSEKGEAKGTKVTIIIPYTNHE